MSGHSKWSTIKRKKGAADQKRGKIFTRCIHEISVAAREGGGDPGMNARLRFALDKAKAANVPNDTIDRAIKRATGELKGAAAMMELSYEGYGPGGTAILIEIVTDNKNRTAGDVRHAFTRCGGSLGEAGCVSWMFTKKGLLTATKSAIEEDQIIDIALSAGADDISGEGDYWEIVCAPNVFEEVKAAISERVTLESAEISMVASTQVSLQGEDAEKMMKLLEALEDLDDVLNVHSNCNFVDS